MAKQYIDDNNQNLLIYALHLLTYTAEYLKLKRINLNDKNERAFLEKYQFIRKWLNKIFTILFLHYLD